MPSRAQQKAIKNAVRQLRNLGELNGVDAANRAVEGCAEDTTLIFLHRSEYEDLCYRNCVDKLDRYKGKQIVVTSDPVQP